MADTTIEQAAQNVTRAYRGTRREHRLKQLMADGGLSGVPNRFTMATISQRLRAYGWRQTFIRGGIPVWIPPPTGLQ